MRLFLYSNDEDRRSENDDRLEYKDEDADIPEVKSTKISSNSSESKTPSKSNRKIDLGAAANFGKDKSSVVSDFLILLLSFLKIS